MSERKAFGPIDETSNHIATQEGLDIYKELVERHGKNSIESLDQIMNSLCVALICLLKDNVYKDNIPNMLQVIHKILSQNTK